MEKESRYKGYSFTFCLHPRKIVNRYTHEPITIPCGQCVACLLRRCYTNQMRCEQEERESPFTYFITLDYNNAHVPLMRLHYDSPRSDGFYLTSMCERDKGWIGDYKENSIYISKQLYDLDKPDHSTKDLQHKMLYFERGVFPYSCMHDCVTFLKRLSIQLKRQYEKLTNDELQLRYFAVSEYGPVHFRPHYHIILYSSANLSAFIKRVADRSWTQKQPYKGAAVVRVYQRKGKQVKVKYRPKWEYVPLGTVDVKSSLGHLSKYLGGYVNSFSRIPRFLLKGCIRPFCHHSIHFGTRTYKDLLHFTQTHEAKELASDDVMCNVLPNGIFSRSTYSRTFFPKCAGFDKSDVETNAFRYNIYNLVTSIFGFGTVSNLADKVVETVNGSFASNNICYDYGVCSAPAAFDLVSYYRSKFSRFTQVHKYDERKSVVVRDLYISLRFISVHIGSFTDGCYPTLAVRKAAQKIHDYYQYLSAFSMKDWYQQQSDYLANFGLRGFTNFYSNLGYLQQHEDLYLYVRGNDKLSLFYRNLIQCTSEEDERNMNYYFGNDVDGLEDIEKTAPYQSFKTHVICEFDGRIKHKVKNDMNKKYV